MLTCHYSPLGPQSTTGLAGNSSNSNKYTRQRATLLPATLLCGSYLRATFDVCFPIEEVLDCHHISMLCSVPKCLVVAHYLFFLFRHMNMGRRHSQSERVSVIPGVMVRVCTDHCTVHSVHANSQSMLQSILSDRWQGRRPQAG